jgi:hypothetical protein
LKEARPLGGPRCRCEDNSKIDIKKEDGNVWSEFIWLRIGISGGML